VTESSIYTLYVHREERDGFWKKKLDLSEGTHSEVTLGRCLSTRKPEESLLRAGSFKAENELQL